MKISIITLFPKMFEDFLKTSIIGRAQKKGLMEFELVDLRQFGEGVHQVVDDRPFGGGAGMVLKADILAKAWKDIINRKSNIGKNDISSISNHETNNRYPITDKPLTILTSASGTPYSQTKARELSKLDHIIIVCGHYEGVDQRFIDNYVDEEISIGDYVLTGGELPSMVIIDSITRLIKGVLEKEEATLDESYENGLLEYPHYTRPAEFEGKKVPEVLISGNHKKIEAWKKEQAEKKTKEKRPDLI